MTGWLARRDPRVRLAMGATWMILALLPMGARGQAAVLVILVIAIVTTARPAQFARWLASFAALGALTWLLDIALSPGPRLTDQWPAWAPGSRAGVSAGLGAAVRVISLGLLGAACLAATTRDEAMDVAAMLLGPLRVVPGLRGIDLSAGLAAATVPLIAEEARDLRVAARFTGGARPPGWRGRVALAQDLAVPLVLGTVQRAETLSRALEARGYVPGARRTRLTGYRVRPADWAALTASTVAAGAVVWTTRA